MKRLKFQDSYKVEGHQILHYPLEGDKVDGC